MSMNEAFGITECLLDCSYRITNVKCVSIDGTVMMISKSDFFRRVRENNEKLIEMEIQQISLLK